jgi:glycosyltransferase involved in cell wall biosynthesis
MKISACLIVKNEADNIGRCLDSLKGVANEIIVVDTGSTDNTKEIALTYGAKIFDYQWDNNFSNAKNFALDQATGDWIIFLDADEFFGKSTQKQLNSVLKHVHPNKALDAIVCKILNIEVQLGRIISENPTIRIFRGKSGIKYEGAIHEQPLKKGKTPVAANITDVSIIVYHTGYSLTILPEKIQRNLKILENEIKNNRITNLTYYYMSSSHYTLRNYEEAIKYARLSLSDPEMKETIMAYLPYVLLVKSMLELKDKYNSEEINKYVNEGLINYPTHPEIWFVKGLAEKAQNNTLAAIESFGKAISLNKSFDLLLNNGFPGNEEQAYFELATLSASVGDHVNALEHYFEVLKINKRNADALAGLYELIKDQQPAEIIFFLNSIYDKENKDDLSFLNAVMVELGNSVLANYYYMQHEGS